MEFTARKNALIHVETILVDQIFLLLFNVVSGGMKSFTLLAAAYAYSGFKFEKYQFLTEFSVVMIVLVAFNK